MVDVATYSDAMEAGAQELYLRSQALQDALLDQHPAAKGVFGDVMGKAMSMFETGAQKAADADDAVDAGGGHSLVCKLDEHYRDLSLELMTAHEFVSDRAPNNPLTAQLYELGWLNWQFERLIVRPLCAVLDEDLPIVEPHDPEIFFWDDYGSTEWPISTDFTPHTGKVGFQWDDDEFVEATVSGHFPKAALLDLARKQKKASAKKLTICLPGGEYEGNSLARDNSWRDAPTYDLSWLPADCELHIAGHPTQETWFREANDGGYGQTMGLYGRQVYRVYDVNLIASRDNALNVGHYGNFDKNRITQVQWFRGRMVAPRKGFRVVRPVSANSGSLVFFGTYFNFGLNGSQEHVGYLRNGWGDSGFVDCFAEGYGGQGWQEVCRKSEGLLHEGCLDGRILWVRTYAIGGTNFNERAANAGVSAQGSCKGTVLIDGGAVMDVPEFHKGADEKGVHGMCNFTDGGSHKSHARPSGKGNGDVVITGGFIGANVGHNRPPIQSDSSESVLMDGVGVFGSQAGNPNGSRSLEFPTGAGPVTIKNCNTPALRQRMEELAAQMGVPNISRANDPTVRRKGQDIGRLSVLNQAEVAQPGQKI